MNSKKCTKCSNKIGWGTILKAHTLSIGYKFECNHCKTKYSIGFISRLIQLVIMLLPITLLQEYTKSIFGRYTLIVWFIWFIIIILISPFFLSIHLEEK